ncbi:uncharacterized protein K02A2.6-like, partial [Tachysurus ichikawai]
MITDHKALELIFNNPKSKPPARIERWALRLQPYKYKVVNKAGKTNPADYMSRHPQKLHKSTITDDVDTEIHIKFIADNAVPKAMTLEEVKAETAKDNLLQCVINTMHNGQWHTLDDNFTSERDQADLRSFHNVKEELTVLDDRSILLKGNPTSTAFAEGKPWKQELYKFLRNYRATPHQTTGISPAELLFGRPMHIKLPTVHSPVHDDALRQADCHKKEKMKQYSDKRKRVSTSELTTGDCILIREKTKGKLKTPYNPKPYKVIKTKGTMITAQRGQHIITRNTSHFKPLKQRVHVPLCDLSDDEMDEFDYGDRPQEQRRPPNVPENPEQRERRYPRRENRKRPQKLMDYT